MNSVVAWSAWIVGLGLVLLSFLPGVAWNFATLGVCVVAFGAVRTVAGLIADHDRCQMNAFALGCDLGATRRMHSVDD